MLYWYNSTHIGAVSAAAKRLYAGAARARDPGAQFTCFTSTRVQILTPEELQALAWHTHEQHIVGVHVRHGDKKTESAVVPMEQYLDAALQIARGRRHEPYHNARQFIYISTDDPEALAAARAWEGLPQHAGSVTVVAREGEVRGVSTATDMVVQMHNVNVTRYGEEAVLNLLLLAHCRAFVGTFSSNFGRLAYELAFARYSVYLLYWYKSTNTDAAHPHPDAKPTSLLPLWTSFGTPTRDRRKGACTSSLKA